jgi:uncharacterized UBP type Zn finger protein
MQVYKYAFKTRIHIKKYYYSIDFQKGYASETQNGILKPPVNRNDTNLCGIRNQGATCYLNTLLQTLYFTKEFRGNLDQN